MTLKNGSITQEPVIVARIRSSKTDKVLETPWTRQICKEMEEYAATIIVHHGNRYVANMPDRQIIWKGMIAFVEFKGVDTPWTLAQQLTLSGIAKSGRDNVVCCMAREAGTKPGEKPYAHLLKCSCVVGDNTLVGSFCTGKQLLDLLMEISCGKL